MNINPGLHEAGDRGLILADHLTLWSQQVRLGTPTRVIETGSSV